MAKKKKEVCPYCGKSFTYLSRHKCKVKERLEGTEESDKSEIERRIERIEERKKHFTRNLKKDERMVLDIIKKKGSLFFQDLLKLTKKNRNDLDDIIDILSLQSKIKVRRELVDASWTKYISAVEEIDLKVKDIEYNEDKKDFILDIFSYQPCLICPFISRCSETSNDQYNPYVCSWLTEWIYTSLEGKSYQVNFEELETESLE